MKYPIKTIALILITAALCSFNNGHTYKIDLNKSGVTWHAPITKGEHNGTIKIKTGYVVCDDDNITSGMFTIDMNSVKDLDLDKQKQPAIETHIASADFFDAARYPYATFKIERVERNAQNNLTAYGNLTIKNVTKAISFPIKVRKFNGYLYVEATKIEINRKQFGVMIKNKGIKGKLEEALIYDVFNVAFSIALKQ